MSQITYVGQVLKDGHLSLTPEVTRALRLRPGDQLRVTLVRGETRGELPEIQSLESLDREELKRIASFQFPRRTQQRMERFLIRNQEGTLTPAEQEELDRLNQESLLQRARKARASYLLSRRSK